MLELDQLPRKPLKKVIENDLFPNLILQYSGIKVGIPYIAGTPGAGKTESIEGMCAFKKWGLISSHIALQLPEEFGGIPAFQDIKISDIKVPGKMSDLSLNVSINDSGDQVVKASAWTFPDIMKILYGKAKEVEDYHNTNNTGEVPLVIWLLDDIHLCEEYHINLMYELFTERKLRGFHLPENVVLILAGNHGSVNAGAKVVNSAVINRCSLMPIESDFQDWVEDFALDNGVHNSIITFLKNNSYRAYFHQEEIMDLPWCSPRSWTLLSNVMEYYEQLRDGKKIKSSDLNYIAASYVGKEAASHFSQYYSIFMKFNIPEILENVDDFKLPSEDISKYALACASGIHFIGRKNKKQLVEPFAKLILKIMKRNEELAVMMMHELKNTTSKIGGKDSFITVMKKLNEFEPGCSGKLIEKVSDL